MMFKTTMMTAAVAVLVSGAAQAQNLESWGTVGVWDVMWDPSLGDGCLIQSEFTDGSVVRIGFDNIEGMGYLTAFNGAWGDIEEGATYPVTFTLDGEAYEGEAKGMYLNGVPGADIYFDSEDFLFDIAARQTMDLANSEGSVMTIDLTGTMAALEEALICQDAE